MLPELAGAAVLPPAKDLPVPAGLHATKFIGTTNSSIQRRTHRLHTKSLVVGSQCAWSCKRPMANEARPITYRSLDRFGSDASLNLREARYGAYGLAARLKRQRQLGKALGTAAGGEKTVRRSST
jgi:hypothetical protein